MPFSTKSEKTTRDHVETFLRFYLHDGRCGIAPTATGLFF